MRMQKWYYFVLVALVAFGAAAFINKGASKPEVKTKKLVQYTPDLADWSTFYSKPDKVASVVSHDPDGVQWITNWDRAKWDGKPYDPTTMSAAKFFQCLCPSVDQIRGLREVFYKHKPFKDNKKPTKAEVDEWHRIAINHIRALVGYTEPDRQVKPDHCLFVRALWGDEFKFTKKWDRYIGKPGSGATGTKGKGHTGASFVPDAKDQAPYLPKGYKVCGTRPRGAEGIAPSPKSDIPWSIKFSRAFCNHLKAEGFWGGHVGPWFHREKFGFSFWDSNPKAGNSIAILRHKWGGKLMNSKFGKNPVEANYGEE